MPLVSRRAAASASGSTTSAGRSGPWATKLRWQLSGRGEPCGFAAALGRRWRGRPQFPRANNSKTWYTSNQEEERPSAFGSTPAVPSLGFTAGIVGSEPTIRGPATRRRLGHYNAQPDAKYAVLAATAVVWVCQASSARTTEAKERAAFAVTPKKGLMSK